MLRTPVRHQAKAVVGEAVMKRVAHADLPRASLGRIIARQTA